MGGRFPPSFVESVRDAADIVRVVSEYVPLKPAGTRMKGLCPFHQEKTPSFSVDPNNQLFYCFGCQSGGDLFKFVMLYEKVGFGEAVEMLASRFGIPLPARNVDSHADDARERMLRLNKAAADFYRGVLASEAGRECREYVSGRGISPETAERLGLGFAPDSWEVLSGHLRAKGFQPADIVRAGLAVPRKSGSGHYDRFRGRLVFPIRDLQGRPVAFGGRALGDAEPKYINSPESPTYTKGKLLYGLDLAREAIRREGFAIVVEGYLDAAALVQAGFDQVVASLGTAFTEAQARLLARYTDRVLVSYDADSAGAQATTRSLDLLLERGFEVRVVELPAGNDPDDFVRNEGAASYERLLGQAPGYLEFLVRQESRSRDLSRLEERVAGVNAVLPHLAKLESSIERAAWAGRLADAFRIDDDLVLQELRSVLRGAKKRVRQRTAGTRGPRWNEARLVALLLGSPDEREIVASSPDLAELETTEVAGIVRAILMLHERGKPIDHPMVLQELSDEEDRDLLTRIAFREDPDDGPTAEDCLCAIKRDALQRREREALRRIGSLQTASAPDGQEMDEWLRQVQQLARQRDALH